MAIYEAILKFQRAHKLTKGTTVDVKGQKPRHYLKLADLLEAMQSFFQDEGIVLTQTYSSPANGTMVCTSTLRKGDETVSNDAVIFMGAGIDPQKSGAAMTYARRYGLMALLGVEADDDDDGETASGRRDRQENQAGASRWRQENTTGRGSQKDPLTEMIDRAFTDMAVPVPERKPTFKRLAEQFGTNTEKTASMLTDMAASGMKWLAAEKRLPCESKGE